jgi:hypothetical protein
VKGRCSSWDSGIGEIEGGKASFASLEKYMLEGKHFPNKSGQELFEAINTYL